MAEGELAAGQETPAWAALRSGRGVKSDGTAAGFDRRLCGGLIGAAARGPVAPPPVLLPACGVAYNRFSVGRCKKKGYLPL